MTPRPEGKIGDNLYIIHRSILGELSLNPVGPDDVNDIFELINSMESHSIELPHNKEDAASSMDTLLSTQSKASTVKYSPTSIRQEHETAAVKLILDEIFTNHYSEYQGFTIRCGDSSKPPSENIIVGFIFIR